MGQYNNMNTRFLILEYLRQYPGMTVLELSQVLQVTPADIRHHLKSLISDELVKRKALNRAHHRGRPAQGFSLSTNQASIAVNRILFSVLTESLSGIDPHAQRGLLKRICDRLVGNVAPQRSMAQKLVHAVQQLTELGFTARWEARPESPQIILEGFPFIIEPQSQQIYLQLTAVLLERLLDSPIRYLSDQRGQHPSEIIYRFSIGGKSPTLKISEKNSR